MAKEPEAGGEVGEAVIAESQNESTRVERRSLDARIADAEQQLKRLQEQKRQRERAEREQRERLLRELLKTEKLDEFPITAWRGSLGGIRELLERASQSR